MTNVAQEILKPKQAGVFRSAFLYTGQGESTLMMIPNGPNADDYLYVLVDSDQDHEPNEIDLVSLLTDLLGKKNLDVFINTHPHNDHIGGIKDIYEKIGIKEVWHSNHKAGGKHKEKYEELHHVIKKVGKSNEFHLKGSNSSNQLRDLNGNDTIKKLGNIDYIVLSPAEHLCDDIEEGTADERDRRIHEQCGVIKFSYGASVKSILITGDSDKPAWQDHITDYHQDKLPSTVLSASHHGSRTFFKNTEEDKDVFEKHIQAIKPDYLIVSAPKQNDSPHGHPHNDAMELYRKYLNENQIFHLGKDVISVIIDIMPDGTIDVRTDKELVKKYGGGAGDKKIDESEKEALFTIASKGPRPWCNG